MSKAAKRNNLPVEPSGDEDDGDIIPSTAPESRTLVMCPKAAASVEQREQNIGPLQPPADEGWHDITGHLTHLFSSAAQLVVQHGSAAPAGGAAVQGLQADGSLSTATPAQELAGFSPALASAISPTMGVGQKMAAILSTDQELTPTKIKSPSVASTGVPFQ
ncbi:unnamed protein product [Lampetra planeri]